MNRENIEKIARTSDDRMLLSHVWDRIQAGMRRDIPTNSCFLSPRELEMARFLFGAAPGIFPFGGYADAERKMLCYLPEYLSEASLLEEGGPIVCLCASYFEQEKPTHRDFLGALMGAGIARETIGDICVGEGSCIFFVCAEVAPYLLQNFSSAGRTKLRLQVQPLAQVQVPEPAIQEVRDTLSSLRLDNVISAGFRIGRSAAVQYVHAGKAAVNGLPCEKPDKTVSQGDRVSVRGLGKIRVEQVNGQTKKGRISVTIHRFV